mmetsp:Transcript_30458/g.85262  ORF Transcript_30458/g.85262 Transcript_30458/m.85262 type:complete len:238 (-) Transcript_30458:738-1451(-)
MIFVSSPIMSTTPISVILAMYLSFRRRRLYIRLRDDACILAFIFTYGSEYTMIRPDLFPPHTSSPTRSSAKRVSSSLFTHLVSLKTFRPFGAASGFRFRAVFIRIIWMRLLGSPSVRAIRWESSSSSSSSASFRCSWIAFRRFPTYAGARYISGRSLSCMAENANFACPVFFCAFTRRTPPTRIAVIMVIISDKGNCCLPQRTRVCSHVILILVRSLALLHEVKRAPFSNLVRSAAR